MSLLVAALLTMLAAAFGGALPIVDPGLFVIMGVRTCGGGDGYCLLGSDCTLDDDFRPDASGHCDGLRNAFTPSAPFVCCRYHAAAQTTAQPGAQSAAGLTSGNNSTTTSEGPSDVGISNKTSTTTTISTTTTTTEAPKTTTTTTTTTSAATTSSSQTTEDDQDWSPITGAFPVFGQDVKEIELDVSIPVGHRPASGAMATSGFIADADFANDSDLEAESEAVDSTGLEVTAGPVVTDSELVSVTKAAADEDIAAGDGSSSDPAKRERWILGRLRRRQGA